jgi:hypothetical protein
MDTDAVTVVALVLLVSLTAVFWDDSPSIIGMATGVFDTSAMVVTVLFDEAQAQQLSPAVVLGPNVEFLMPVEYNGTGSMRVTATKPSLFASGSAWQIDEDGTVTQVQSSSMNLIWDAELDAEPVTLRFEMPPPVLTVTNTTDDRSKYRRSVLVSAEYDTTDVVASVAVDGSYAQWTIFEVNATENQTIYTDTTQEYALQVTDGTATWRGFAIGTAFMIEGRAPANGGRRGGGGGAGAMLSRDSTTDSADQGTLQEGIPDEPAAVSSQESMITITTVTVETTVVANERGLVFIEVYNQGPAQNVTIQVPGFLDGPSVIEIPSGPSKIEMRTRDLPPGEWRGRVSINGTRMSAQAIILVKSLSPAPPSMQQPATVESSIQTPRRIGLAIVFLITVLTAAAYGWGVWPIGRR